MNYITIFGACESIDDASYERDEDQENGTTIKVKVVQTQLTLSVPGMRDLVRVTFPDVVRISPEWEDKMVLLKVEADKFTVSSGIRNKKAWAVASFHGVAVEPASNNEAAELSKQRKSAKAAAKSLRAANQAKKLKTAS